MGPCSKLNDWFSLVQSHKSTRIFQHSLLHSYMLGHLYWENQQNKAGLCILLHKLNGTIRMECTSNCCSYLVLHITKPPPKLQTLTRCILPTAWILHFHSTEGEGMESLEGSSCTGIDAKWNFSWDVARTLPRHCLTGQWRFPKVRQSYPFYDLPWEVITSVFYWF